MKTILTAIAVLWLSAVAHAEPGVTSSRIVIGQSAALTGPAAQLGIDMKTGAAAYFKMVNDQGGVHGRQVELITRDDGYEVDRARQNTRELIEKDDVFALFGYVGASTSDAATPLFTAAEVPFFGAFTGANSLREPFNRHVFNLRASHDDEVERLVEYLVTTGVKRIAVFHQNDAYGKAGLDSAIRAMAKRKLAPAAIGAVERNSVDIAGAAGVLLSAAPDAIIQISSYSSCAALINSMRASGYGGRFLNVSFVGSKALADMLGSQGVGVIVSQVVPFPWSASTLLQREYAAAMKRAGHTQFNFGSMEGFLAAKVFVEGLRRAGDNPTRKKLVAALETLRDYDAGGFRVTFGPQDRNGSKFVDVTLIGRDGKFIR